MELQEAIIRRALPITALAALVLSACGGENRTPAEQMQDVLNDTTTLCADEAQTAFDTEFPKIELGDEPSLDELREAVDVTERRETEGAAYYDEKLENCIDDNFYGRIETLKPTVEISNPGEAK